jgi:hypothetical protein
LVSTNYIAMNTTAITKAQRKAAKAAGLAYLHSFAIVVYVNFGIHSFTDDAGETARNIAASERLYCIGMLGDLLYCTGVIVLLTALYITLKPVSAGIALLATFWRLVWVLMWLTMTLNLFDALRLLDGADYQKAFGTECIQSLVKFHLATCFDYYYDYVGLLFGALASRLVVFFGSGRDISPALSIFGIVSSAFCVLCTLIFYIFPGLDKIVNLWCQYADGYL